MKLLIAGGAGFIGSNFARLALTLWPESEVVVLDALTYAGNTDNLVSIWDDNRFLFVHGDICDSRNVRSAMSGCTHVVNFAAETHVDRSIHDAGAFVRTDVEGTRTLLQAATDFGVERYLQVSTDEVYGHVEAPKRSREGDALRPRSPYAASKAGGDLMVGAYHVTHGLPTLVTRGSNTYGPYQFPEKIIPLFVTNALDGLALPVYGDGKQMRDWLYVDDHCRGIATVLERGIPGRIYNIGVGNELPNMEVVDNIVNLTGCDPALVRHVPDRPGHDRRYALRVDRTIRLGWSAQVPFDMGLQRTVEWYRSNRTWWERLKSGDFQAYYQLQYGSRLAESAS